MKTILNINKKNETFEILTTIFRLGILAQSHFEMHYYLAVIMHVRGAQWAATKICNNVNCKIVSVSVSVNCWENLYSYTVLTVILLCICIWCSGLGSGVYSDGHEFESP